VEERGLRKKDFSISGFEIKKKLAQKWEINEKPQ
jgi:hypothetical protein